MDEEFDKQFDDLFEESKRRDERGTGQSVDADELIKGSDGDGRPSNEQLFLTAREEVCNEISFNLDLLKATEAGGGPRNMTSVIINLNGLRQRIVDANNNLKSVAIRLKTAINQKKGNEYDSINNDMKIRVKNKDDKYAIVKGRIAELESKYYMIDNQIDFNLESIKTIDGILMGSKHIMDVEKTFGAIMYKGRNK